MSNRECIQHGTPLTGDYCGPECDRLTAVYWSAEDTSLRENRACGTCGEREGSVYAKRCCENQDWVEV